MRTKKTVTKQKKKKSVNNGRAKVEYTIKKVIEKVIHEMSSRHIDTCVPCRMSAYIGFVCWVVGLIELFINIFLYSRLRLALFISFSLALVHKFIYFFSSHLMRFKHVSPK